jgi:hypothetical protein
MKYRVDRSVLHDALQQAEQKFDVLNWIIQAVPVWPLIRHKFSLGYLLSKSQASKKGNLGKRVVLALKGIKEIIILVISFRVKRQPYEYLFLTKSTYRSKIDEFWYEKFCDSTIDALGEDFKRKACILESGVDLHYRKPRYKSATVFEVQGAFYLIGLFAQLFSRGTVPSLDEYDAFKAFMKKQTGYASPLTLLQLNTEVFRIRVLSSFFAFILTPMPLKKIFTICYYEEFGYAMMLAAAKNNITSVDIQHGVQGKFHFAYMPFTKIPGKGYDLLPDHFWVWNKASFENITEWKSSEHKPFLGGNLWLSKWADKPVSRLSEKPIILVSLQPVADTLPQFLLDAIVATIDKFSWFLRLHPRQMGERKQIENMLEAKGLINQVELAHATEQPLPLLLLQTTVHITQWSSVVIEAAESGVPSILIHPTGKLMYATEEFEQHFIYYAENKQQICDILKILNRPSDTLSESIQKPDIAKFVFS